MRVYYDRDADINLIKGKNVVIIGYGSQGFAHALNLKESGVPNVSVALRKGSASAAKAEGAGLKVLEVAEAAKTADVMMMLTPDELQGEIYAKDLAPNMKQGAALFFAHGLNIHFNLIEPRKDLDIAMVAPKGPGHTVRGEYLKGGGVPCPSPCIRTPRAMRWRSGSPMPARSAAAAPASSRRPSARNARRIFSASRSCSAAGWWSSLAPASRRSSRTLRARMAYFETLQLKVTDRRPHLRRRHRRYSGTPRIQQHQQSISECHRGRIITPKTKAEMKHILDNVLQPQVHAQLGYSRTR